MSNNVYSDSHWRDEFLHGAARAFFVSSYADFVEDEDRDPQDQYDYLAAGPGEDWMNVAPETPPAAYALAGELWALLEVLNKENAPAGVYSLMKQAADTEGTAIDAEEFGHCMAMQAMGTGVSWFDDHTPFRCEIPHMECYQLSFDLIAYRSEFDRPPQTRSTAEVSLTIPRITYEGVRAHWLRACHYWLDDEPHFALTDAIIDRGIARLLERGGRLAALLIEDWTGDDDVYDAIVQLGFLGELRYG